MGDIDNRFEQAPITETGIEEVSEGGLKTGVTVASTAGRVGLMVLMAGASAMAQTPLVPTEAIRNTIITVDPNAEIVDGVVVVASSAEAACSLLNEGVGFYIADAGGDPRILLIGGVGGPDTSNDALSELPPLVMPANFDPCIWNALVELAPNVEDVRIIASFDSVRDGTGTLPPPPFFINGTLSPTLIGLEEGALPTEIGPRWAALTTLLNQAEEAAGDQFYVPEAALNAEAARALREDIERAITN